jgi:hypothetical protein
MRRQRIQEYLISTKTTGKMSVRNVPGDLPGQGPFEDLSISIHTTQEKWSDRRLRKC